VISSPILITDSIRRRGIFEAPKCLTNNPSFPFVRTYTATEL